MKFDLQAELFSNNKIETPNIIAALKTEYGDGVNVGALFMILNKEIPNNIVLGEIGKKKAIENLINEYKVPATNILKSQSFITNKIQDNSVTIALRKNLIVDISERDETLPDTASIYYGSSIEEEELKKIKDILKKHKKKVKTENKVFLLQTGFQGMLGLQSFEIKKKTFDLVNHYNEDFIEVSKIIEEKLNKKDENGIIILHGEAGTGKTTYIRYLATTIKKKLIYIPPDLTYKLSSPDFLPLLFDHPNSVLIVEDAENILEERRAGSSDSISNLLNIADGLLSDCLKIQIICTFNTPLENIDRALLRKGRLIARYNFKSLEAKKAQNLSNKLGFKKKINKAMSLAEIYNLGSRDFMDEEERSLGFELED